MLRSEFFQTKFKIDYHFDPELDLNLNYDLQVDIVSELNLDSIFGLPKECDLGPDLYFQI